MSLEDRERQDLTQREDRDTSDGTLLVLRDGVDDELQDAVAEGAEDAMQGQRSRQLATGR